ncbi:GDSL esterase/lipase EXL3-like [Senna tora]|uniref:GDSL esterase/lipase EXL3-like n=1 Tax=Senna tora TaxID=362788 RepID=A0A834WRM0_9FABA|nr:GDSL esterase/lipase EXL3-like [Senna tora]
MIPGNQSVPALIVFGDSIVDSGTAELGIKKLVPSYMEPALQPSDLRTGVSFASGGSGYDPLTPKILNVISLSEQVQQFKEYIGKLKGKFGEETTNSILSKSIILVVASSNDIAVSYFDTGIRKAQYDISSYTDVLIQYASSFIEEIYGLGGRKIGVFSAPPLGCLPSQRTVLGGIERKCKQEVNDASNLFNSKFSAHLQSLSQNLPQANLVFIDVYSPLLHIINNPTSYGFEVVDKGCCGTGTIEASVLCNPLDQTCTDDSKVPMAIKEPQAGAVTIPALFAFGDSILDTGNNNNLNTLTKSNFPPYGVNFIGAKPTGRFCDGKVPSDLIAEALGIKDTLPAYLDPNLRNEDLSTGVCFASGGSGNDERANTIISNALFLFSSGNNDIAITYSSMTVRRLQYDFPTYSNNLVASASSFLKDVYGLGARRIWVLSTLPLGCLPGVKAVLGGLSIGLCVDFINAEAQLFNSKLSSELVSIKSSLVDYDLHFLDVYNPLLHLIQNPRKSGFENVGRGCCGTGTVEIAASCNRLNPFTCANPSKYVFWDSGHPTQAAYHHLVSHLLQTHNFSTLN